MGAMEGVVGVEEMPVVAFGAIPVASEGLDPPMVPRYGTCCFGGGARPCLCAGELVVLRETGAESVAAESTRGALFFTSLPTSSAVRLGGRFVDAAGGLTAPRAPLSLRGAGLGFEAGALAEGFVGLPSWPVLIEERTEFSNCA